MASSAPYVETVNGPVPVEALGAVLPHEHLQIDLVKEWRGNGAVNNFDLAVGELNAARSAGCRTVVDCTTAQIGRDPRVLKRLSDAAGVHVVMGTGHYREPYIENYRVNALTARDLADEMVAELRDGVRDTGIRPGVIGEVGCEGAVPTAVEERALRAAALAALTTDTTITTHAARHPVGFEQLRLFRQEGVRPGRVIIGHCSTVHDVSYHRELAEAGCFVQFDTVRGLSDFDDGNTADYVLRLAEDGFLNQVLLSQDVCLRSHLTAYGGNGYGFLFTHFLPRLRDRGLTEDDLRTLTVENPARALARGPVDRAGAFAPADDLPNDMENHQ
ncbi:phosphotriesterase family protein [Amycolatopsis jejuensis]|uniref:phosphotriesterase family protein n=1 Tax=Amycolatopsis jejuensis TaxID=330084 RepID=UPI00052657D8|nr:hypothetical protein [Amycolatopsis jejuensis]